MPRRWRSAALVTVLLTVPAAAAQAPLGPGWMAVPVQPVAGVATFDGAQPVATGIEAAFQAGATTTQLLAGLYASGLWGPRSRQYNYVPVSVRQGVMTTSPEDHWWGHGNYECLFDVTGAAVTTRYGNWFAGSTFFARANWVEPGWSVVPYLQAGTGAVYNDAYKDQTQRALGQGLEFYLHLEAGLKYFIAPNLSLDIEGGLQHQSNGGLASRNYGINCYGGAVGLTYYFPCGGQ